MRYWRHYPKFLQTLLLMLMIFTLASFGLLVAGFLNTQVLGLSSEALAGISDKSSIQVIHAAQLFQGISSLCTFLLSALLFAYLTHPHPFTYLGFSKPKHNTVFIWLFLLMISFAPILSQIGAWMQLIDFGTGARANFDRNQEMTKALMNGHTTGNLILYLFLFALLPAFGEELLFRGVVMRFAYNGSKNIHLAILFSAAIFGMAHGTVYNFLPIMLAGVLLGYLYYWTSSIWFSIIAHFLNNAIMIIGLFLANNTTIDKKIAEGENLPWYVLVSAVVLFIFALSLIRKNATPLAPDWNDDFKGERQVIN